MSNLVDIKEEWYTTKHSDTQLLLRIWSPKDTQPNTVVIFLHGFGEHTGRYLEFFKKFAQNGIKVISFDQRGHGQTGKKINKIGVGSSTKILFKDIDELIEKYRDATANLVLMGHSYGGLAAFNYAANGSQRNLLDGLIGASPGFIVPPEILPHPIIVFVLKRLVHILPNFVTKANIDASLISRDEAEIKKYKEDPLITDKSSLIYANDVINPGSINEDCKKIQVPSVFLVHGTADKVTIPSGSKHIYETMSKSHPNISIKWFEGGYHELHNDLCKDEISNDYITWIRNLKPKLETASKL